MPGRGAQQTGCGGQQGGCLPLLGGGCRNPVDHRRRLFPVLLNHMGQFVGQQFPAGTGLWCIFLLAEIDVIAAVKALAFRVAAAFAAPSPLWTRTRLKSWPNLGSKNARQASFMGTPLLPAVSDGGFNPGRRGAVFCRSEAIGGSGFNRLWAVEVNALSAVVLSMPPPVACKTRSAAFEACCSFESPGSLMRWDSEGQDLR